MHIILIPRGHFIYLVHCHLDRHVPPFRFSLDAHRLVSHFSWAISGVHSLILSLFFININIGLAQKHNGALWSLQQNVNNVM